MTDTTHSDKIRAFIKSALCGRAIVEYETDFLDSQAVRDENGDRLVDEDGYFIDRLNCTHCGNDLWSYLSGREPIEVEEFDMPIEDALALHKEDCEFRLTMAIALDAISRRT